MGVMERRVYGSYTGRLLAGLGVMLWTKRDARRVRRDGSGERDEEEGGKEGSM
jgi:hypothetical protein